LRTWSRKELGTLKELGSPPKRNDDDVPDLLDIEAWPGRTPQLSKVLSNFLIRHFREELGKPTSETKIRNTVERELIKEELKSTAQDINDFRDNARRLLDRRYVRDFLHEDEIELVHTIAGLDRYYWPSPDGRPHEEHVSALRIVIACLEPLTRRDGQKLKNRDIAHLIALIHPSFLYHDHSDLVTSVRKHRTGISMIPAGFE